MIFNKLLDQISKDDLQELIANKAEESLTLEFKRELPLKNKEIARDVSSMANSKGGLLIYGIEQDDNNRARKLIGVEGKNTKEKIEDVVLSSIQPRLEVDMQSISLSPDPAKIVMLLRIPESSRAPHTVVADRDYRYYRRRNFQASMMEEFEVRELYGRLVDMSLKVDSFLTSKGYGLLDPNNNGEPWSSVLVCPTILREDLLTVDQATREFMQRQQGHYETDINFHWRDLEPSIDGFECVGRELNSDIIYRLFEINRNGCVQLARSLLTNDPNDRRLYATHLAIQLVNTLLIASKLYQKVDYLGNVKIVMGVNNIGGFELMGNPGVVHFGKSVLRGRHFLRVPREKFSGLLASEGEKVARDMMDQLYNGFGRMKSDLFSDDGKFKPPR